MSCDDKEVCAFCAAFQPMLLILDRERAISAGSAWPNRSLIGSG